jgi:hypothetical protein
MSFYFLMCFCGAGGGADNCTVTLRAEQVSGKLHVSNWPRKCKMFGSVWHVPFNMLTLRAKMTTVTKVTPVIECTYGHKT